MAVSTWIGNSALAPNEPNGFADRSDCVLSWDDGTRTLTLTGPFTAWSKGASKTINSDSLQISDTEGDHFFYYDENFVLSEVLAFDISLIRELCYVAYVYWDATNNKAVPFPINEQHGMSMDSASHEYLHRTRGTQYDSGLLPTPLDVDGAGIFDVIVNVTAGVIWDEDIRHTVGAITAPQQVPVLWKEGAAGLWRYENSFFPGILATDRPYFNEFDQGVWQRTEIANNNFMMMHLYALPGTNADAGKLAWFMGENEYATKPAAEAAAETEILDLNLNGLPSQEFKEVATIILECKTSYTNAISARIVSTASGDDFIDWRTAL